MRTESFYEWSARERKKKKKRKRKRGILQEGLKSNHWNNNKKKVLSLQGGGLGGDAKLFRKEEDTPHCSHTLSRYPMLVY